MKIWYFENTHRDKSKDILYDIILACLKIYIFMMSYTCDKIKTTTFTLCP